VTSRCAALVFLALVGCDRVFGIGDPYEDARAGSGDEDATPDAPGSYEKSITIVQPTNTPLASFPVSIAIAADPDLAAHVVDSTGADIGFVDDANNPLPCEIVQYTPSMGALDAWVLPPELPANPASLTIHLVYGGSATRCTTSPWPATHVAVLHGDIFGNQDLDRSGHGHNMLASPAQTAPTASPGIVGQALSFDGVDDQMCAGDVDGSLDFGTSSFSYSIWVNTAGSLGMMDSPFDKRTGASVTGTGFGFYLGKGEWDAIHGDGTNTATTPVRASPSVGTWHNLVVIVYRPSTQISTLLDGAGGSVSAIPGYGSFTSSAALCMSPTAFPYKGLVDEVQILSVPMSANWWVTAYANIANPSSMIAFGSEERL
jgi:hypothetical protein